MILLSHLLLDIPSSCILEHNNELAFLILRNNLANSRQNRPIDLISTCFVYLVSANVAFLTSLSCVTNLIPIPRDVGLMEVV